MKSIWEISNNSIEFASAISWYLGRIPCLSRIHASGHKFWSNALRVPEGAMVTLGNPGGAQKILTGVLMLYFRGSNLTNCYFWGCSKLGPFWRIEKISIILGVKEVPLHALITWKKFQFKQKNMTNVACFHGQHFLCSEGNRDLKQHDADMRRRWSLAKWLFNCSHASAITDPIWIRILWMTAASSWPRRVA